MIRALAAALALAAVLSAAASAQGRGRLSGWIVVSATDAPHADDVMLVRADSSRVDLGRGATGAASPVLSPNGKLVAFYGGGVENVVGIDGTGTRRVTPRLAFPPAGVAWAPNGRDLAILMRNRLYLARSSGGLWKQVATDGALLEGWAPDGTRVAYVDGVEDVVVLSRSGKRLLRVDGLRALWSAAGRLAVQLNSTTWGVYGAAGQRLSTLGATDAAWSADGRLATIDGRGVLAIRRGGTGRPTVTARPVRGGGEIRWAGPTHVLVGDVLFDVPHRSTFLAPAAYRGEPTIAPDGTAFAESGLSLVRSTLSGSTRTLESATACGGKDTQPFASLQALPDGSAAVYQSTCAPPHDLFSLAPDGSLLSQITDTPQDELDPAVSPDGAQLAFARQDSGDCVGCTVQLWITGDDAAGGHAVPLPPATGGPILQDDEPSFSPDGRTVVFSRWNSGVSDTAFLAEVPAAGGAVTVLKVAGSTPAWGPSRIAYDGADGVATVAPDGGAAVTVAKHDDALPAWSPDGRLALLERDTALAIVFPGGGTRVPLPGLRAPASFAWSPDGTRFALTATDADGVTDVWTVNADGTGLTRVTHGLGADGGIAWR